MKKQTYALQCLKTLYRIHDKNDKEVARFTEISNKTINKYRRGKKKIMPKHMASITLGTHPFWQCVRYYF